MIMMMPQSYKEFTSCNTANIIPATIIQIRADNKQIQTSKESINELKIRK